MTPPRDLTTELQHTRTALHQAVAREAALQDELAVARAVLEEVREVLAALLLKLGARA